MKKILGLSVALIIVLMIPTMSYGSMGQEERIQALNDTMAMSLDILKNLNTVYTIQPDMMNDKFVIMAYQYYTIYITAYEMQRIENDETEIYVQVYPTDYKVHHQLINEAWEKYLDGTTTKESFLSLLMNTVAVYLE